MPHLFYYNSDLSFFLSNLDKVDGCSIKLFGCPSVQLKTKIMKRTLFSYFFTSSLKVNFGCETLKIYKC